MIGPHVDEGRLHEWLDGELPDREAETVVEHLAGCPACEALLERCARDRALASGLLGELDRGDRIDAPVGAPAASSDAGDDRAGLDVAAAEEREAVGAGGGATVLRPGVRGLAWAASLALAVTLGWMAGRGGLVDAPSPSGLAESPPQAAPGPAGGGERKAESLEAAGAPEERSLADAQSAEPTRTATMQAEAMAESAPAEARDAAAAPRASRLAAAPAPSTGTENAARAESEAEGMAIDLVQVSAWLGRPAREIPGWEVVAATLLPATVLEGSPDDPPLVRLDLRRAGEPTLRLWQQAAAPSEERAPDDAVMPSPRMRPDRRLEWTDAGVRLVLEGDLPEARLRALVASARPRG